MPNPSSISPITRRDFLASAAVAGAMSLAAGCQHAMRNAPASAPPDRPNILWITAEDMNAHLGCYGDKAAKTPNLDAFASQAVKYTHAFATAPVCSPARSCLITGVYATSLGTHPLRCQVKLPAEIRPFPAWLREAGYFTSNNVKTDYNVADEKTFIADAWDRCDELAHWRQRKDGQPFFSVINLMTTHQSRSSVWPEEQFEKEIASQLSPTERTDPAKVTLPPYYPDTPLARKQWARYYDCIAVMDKQVGAILRQLDDDGLADNTIVFFYGDNGAGIPLHKRLLHDSGLHVPLLVRFPAKYRHLAPANAGTTTDRLVSFVDFAPSILSLAALPIPKHMQGQPFLGPAATAPRQYVYGARDRVDEAFDLSRSVRDNRWLYIRNYMPHLSWAPPEGYSDQSAFRRELRKMAAEGKLSEEQMLRAGPIRLAEELYDTAADPHQVRNLANAREHRAVLAQMRTAHIEWELATRDLGFMPESEMALRTATRTAYELRNDTEQYPLEWLMHRRHSVGARICPVPLMLEHRDSAIRYWGAVTARASAVLRIHGDSSIISRQLLVERLDDPSASVRIEVAGALSDQQHDPDPRALNILTAALTGPDLHAAVHAARTLQLLGEKARPALPAMREMLKKAADTPGDPHMFIRFALEPAVKQ